MKSYEFIFIANENNKEFLKETEELIKSLDGKVEEKEEWGKKNFAYRMKKLTSGFYFIWQLNFPPASVKEFKNKLRLKEYIVRYLLLNKE